MRKYLIIVIAALVLYSCNTKNSTAVGDTEIYLKVIKDITPDANIRDCIEFSDNRGSAHSLPSFPEYFMTRVNAGKKVTWMSSPDSDPKILILEVNFKPNKVSTPILIDGYIKGENGIATSIVKKKGEVKNLSNEFYNITFSINNKVYTIDPILQFHAE
ncbi:hypothetical protein QWY87_09045 [Lutimonas halocynthiae]|uniref:hypothetical protein n=1 Tax=Lutimonas halocynthiae TaxID=1446477 RepID=UPI0025B45A76|nr:hypothetical protein [Lutimonas halocynthiae]MDN3642843.1 hypothetical protein [Lutimonas halocynthiae]